MSETLAASVQPSRRKLSIVGSQLVHARTPPGGPSRARSFDIEGGDCAWPQRGGAHARNDLRGESMAVLSHELRNSLCVMAMAAGILNMEVSASPAVVKARTLIEHQTAHMSRLVEDLLDTSGARSGHLALRFQKVDLCGVVAQALQSVEFTMLRRGHRMTVSLPAVPLWVQADSARLEQVFSNLLVNAAKYTDGAGDIRLSVEREEGEAVVRIRDNGIGIASNLLPRVFDLFVQADPSSRHTGGGLGIGLALVRNLVDRHGGSVAAASAGLGHGSEFVVRLPIPS
jgi:signal transduction histidine kinase